MREHLRQRPPRWKWRHRPPSPSAPAAASTAVPGEERREGENTVPPLRPLIAFAVRWAQPFRRKEGKKSPERSH